MSEIYELLQAKSLLICGSRNWKNQPPIRALIELSKASAIIHGGATGADSYAGAFATLADKTVIAFPVNESIDGPWPAAGPRRNGRMLRLGKPAVVVAFPAPCLSQSRGTLDMVRQAYRAGVPVLVWGLLDPVGFTRYSPELESSPALLDKSGFSLTPSKNMDGFKCT